MNQEMREAFDDLKGDMKDAHKETREKISDWGTLLNRHMLEDALAAKELHDHLEDEKSSRKWRWALYAGIIITFLSVVGERIASHIWKG